MRVSECDKIRHNEVAIDGGNLRMDWRRARAHTPKRPEVYNTGAGKMCTRSRSHCEKRCQLLLCARSHIFDTGAHPEKRVALRVWETHKLPYAQIIQS